MKWRTTNSWGSFQLALLAFGMALPFCLPGRAEARCASAHAWLYTQVTAQPEATETVPSAGPVCLRSLEAWPADHREVGRRQLARDSQQVWHGMWDSFQGAPCERCPFGLAPGRRCEGPNCSGEAPPTALPMPGFTAGSNESASLPGLGQSPRQGCCRASSALISACRRSFCLHIPSFILPAPSNPIFGWLILAANPCPRVRLASCAFRLAVRSDCQAK